MPNGVQVFVWCPSEAQAEQQKAAEEAEEAKLKARLIISWEEPFVQVNICVHAEIGEVADLIGLRNLEN